MKEYTKEQIQRLREFVTMDDWDFYEKYLADAPLEEQAAFMKAFPQFLNEGDTVDGVDTEEILRKIMELIKSETHNT